MCCNPPAPAGVSRAPRIDRSAPREEEDPWAGTVPGALTADEIVALSREHTFFSWCSHRPHRHRPRRGVWLYTPDGRKILDFNSQLMSVNIGHGDRRVIDAITEQATKLQYVQPAFATEIRRASAPSWPRSCRATSTRSSSLGGAEAIENAIKLARHYTGRYKVLARLSLLPRRDDGGDDAHRRPAPAGERARPRGVVRPGHAPVGRGGTPARGGIPAGPRGRHPLRGRTPSPRSSSRPSSARTASSSRPTASRASARSATATASSWSATRSWRDRADRPLVRGRPLGRRAGPDDDGQGPDVVLPAPRWCRDATPHRGLLRTEDVLRRADLFVAPGLAGRGARTIGVYEEDGLIDNAARLGARMREHHERLAAKHPSVGRTATSACSASSISSGRAIRGRR